MNVVGKFWSENLPIHRESQYSLPEQPSPLPTPSVTRPPLPQQVIQHRISLRDFQRKVESLCIQILELTDTTSDLKDVGKSIKRILKRASEQHRLLSTKRRPLRRSSYDSAMITIRSNLQNLLDYLIKYNNDTVRYNSTFVRKKLKPSESLKVPSKQPEPPKQPGPPNQPGPPKLEDNVLYLYIHQIEKGYRDIESLGKRIISTRSNRKIRSSNRRNWSIRR